MPHDTKFGHYRLIRPLGSGGIGEVHLAFDPEHSREVALKLLPLSRATAGRVEAEKHRVALQKKISAEVPQIAAVHDHGERDGYYFVDMEYVDGQELQAISSSIDERRSVAIARGLSSVIERCHRFEPTGRQVPGIAHGRLRSDTIYIQPGDRVRILDLGQATLAPSSSDLDADLWACGVALYQLLFDQLPFPGESAESNYRPAAVRQPLATSDRDVSVGLHQILQRCLNPRPSLRYQSAEDLANDLAACRLDEPRDTTNGAPDQGSALTPATASIEDEAANEFIFQTRDAPETSTAPDPPASAPSARPSTASPSRSSALPTLPTRKLGAPRPWHRRLAVAVALAALLLFANELAIGVQCHNLDRQIESGSLDLDQGIERLIELDQRCLIGLGSRDTKDKLKHLVLEDVNPVLESFHDDVPLYPSKDLQIAALRLERLLSLDDSNDTVAKHRVCVGHLACYAAESARSLGDHREAAASRKEAIRAFREAARRTARMPGRHPAPHMGLARVYSESPVDLESLEKALKDAAAAGFYGEPAILIRARAHLRLGRQELEDSSNHVDVRQQVDQICQKARPRFEDAQNLYDEILNSPTASIGRNEAWQGLQEIEQRLRDLGDYFC